MLGILIASALAQQVNLSYAPGPGSRTNVEITTTLNYRVLAEDREKSLNREVESHLSENYVQEVTSTGAKGPTGLSLECKHSYFSRTSKDGVGTISDEHRKGKHLDVTRSGGVHQVTIGGLDGAETDSHVGRWVDFVGLFPPDGKASPGNEWPADLAALSGLLIQTKASYRKEGQVIRAVYSPATVNGSINCKLASVDGGVATIAFTGTVTASSSEYEKITITIEAGELKFNASETVREPVSLTIKGSIKIEREVVEEEFRKDLMDTHKTNAGKITIESTQWESAIRFSPAE